MTYVALLRGINVGGNRKVEMKRLKETFERVGMTHVRTYINSGNVVFRSDEKPDDLARILRDAIQADFGFDDIPIMVRDVDNVEAVVAALPDGWHNDSENKCDVMFLGDDIDSPDVLDGLTVKEFDDVIYVPGAILWRVDKSLVTRSGLLKIMSTPLYAQMTVRNCNTARKLATIMAEVAEE